MHYAVSVQFVPAFEVPEREKYAINRSEFNRTNGVVAEAIKDYDV